MAFFVLQFIKSRSRALGGIEFEYRLLAESRLRCSKKTFLPLAFFYSGYTLSAS